ncbi:sodium-dependent glucose transporter 1C-like [Glandiceps talaboti]
MKSEDEKKEESFIRIVKTSLVYLTLFGVGFVVAVFGPCLLDFQLLLGTSLQKATFIFTARSTGYFIGCLVWGACLDKFDNQFILGSCLLGASITGVSIAWCKEFALLICMIAAWGFCVGGLETGGNVVCVNVWGRDSGPWLQGLHFCFAVGATVAPLIAGPFLTPPSTESFNTTYASSIGPQPTYIPSLLPFDPNVSVLLNSSDIRETNIVNFNTTTEPTFRGNGTLWVPYTILSLFFFAVALPFFWLFIRGPRLIAIPKDRHSDLEQSRQEADTESAIFKATLIILLFLFSFSFIGHEITYGGFIYTFAIKSDYGFTVKVASYLNSAFWASFAAARGLGIFCAMFLSPRTMLIMDLCGMCTASTLLVIFGDTSLSVVWGASILLGLSLATVFPSAISWAECYIKLTGKAMSTFTMAAATSEMILPYVLGLLFDAYNVMMLMYMTLALSLSSTFVYIIMQIIASCHGERYQEIQQSDDEMNVNTRDIELSNRSPQSV